MAITDGTISVPGVNGAEIKLKTQNDSTNGTKNPVHPIVNAAGANINPATAENQAAANTALQVIQTSVAKIPASPATSTHQDATNTKLDSLIAIAAAGSACLFITPTVTAALHANNVVIGGKLSLDNAARVSGGSGLIQSVLVHKRSNLIGPVDVYFFNANPASTFSENQPLPDFSVDLPIFIGVAHCEDVIDHGTAKTLQVLNLAMPFDLVSGTTLYAVPVLRQSETFGSTSEISMQVGLVRD